MFKPHRILLAGALLAMASTTTQAGTLGAGGLSGGANQVPVSPSPYLTDGVTLTPGYTVDGDATGSLSGFHAVGNVTVNLASLGSTSFSFTDGTNRVLSFTTSAVVQTPSVPVGFPGVGPYSYLGITLKGIVTLVDPNTHTTESSDGQLTLSFNQSGTAGIGSGLSLLITPIPEPTSIALAGIGMAAAGLFGLRKRYAK